MSHLGSFEIAAGAFREVRLKLLLIMGEKEAKQVARDQREAMKARGIHIQVATAGEDFLSSAEWRPLSSLKKEVSSLSPGILFGPNSAPVYP